jgi:putative transposase
MDGAQRLFRQAVETVGHRPDRVTTDGHDAYPRAVRETLGNGAVHRCNRYLNNRTEQDRRGIKQRYYPMRGFGSVESAARFWPAFVTQRQYFRSRRRMGEYVPLAQQRRLFRERRVALLREIEAA